MTENFDDIRDSVRALCANFPGEYWRKLDAEKASPTEASSLIWERKIGALLWTELAGKIVGQ